MPNEKPRYILGKIYKELRSLYSGEQRRGYRDSAGIPIGVAVMDSLLSRLSEYPAITRRELRALLCGRISTDERRSLKNGSDGLIISVPNRKTIIRMLEDTFSYEADNEPVDVSQVISLIQALQSYLNKYMADKPEGHRWIIICCVYLSMVMHEPLHPREAAHWEWDGGVGEYRCRFREDMDGSICRWCRCIPVKEF